MHQKTIDKAIQVHELVAQGAAPTTACLDVKIAYPSYTKWLAENSKKAKKPKKAAIQRVQFDIRPVYTKELALVENLLSTAAAVLQTLKGEAHAN